MTTSSVKFGELTGTSNPEPQHLEWFVDTWFRPEDEVVIGGFPVSGGPKLFTTFTAKEILEKPNEVLQLSNDGSGRYTLYFTVNPIRDRNLVTGRTRGSNNTKTILGFFADIDIKPGSFPDKDSARTFLEALELKPTIIVDGGSGGGIHAYWRLSDFDVDKADREHLKAFWCWLQESAPEGVAIDGLIDKERLARLPSAPRWSEHRMEDRIRLVGGTGRRVRLVDVEQACKAPYEAHKAAVRDTRSRVDKADRELELHAPGTNSLLAKALIEIKVNQLDWTDILTPHGWTFLREEHTGARQWARPGSSTKSAVTDFKHDDGTISDVMSLFSASPDTGLLDLKEAEVVLTKYRVLLELNYGGDVNALIQDFRN